LTSALRPQKEATETLEEAAKEVAIATEKTLQNRSGNAAKKCEFSRVRGETQSDTEDNNTRAMRTLMKKRDRKAQKRGAETR
jgi:hypothetical protein